MRMSGPENLRGFDYQISYTVHRLILLLLNDRENVITIKFESLNEEEEDFNIYWKDGSVEYVQVKKRDEGYHWTPSDIKNLILHYEEKYNINTNYRFVTNGSANTDVRDFKKKVNKGKIPEDKVLKKFKPDNVELIQLRNIVKSMKIDTIYFPSNIEEDPALKLKQEIVLILNGPHFYLTKAANEIFDLIWKFIFDKSKSSSEISIEEINEAFYTCGARIIEEREWLRIPNIHDFSSRDIEAELISCSLLETGKVVIKGISGIGKTFLAAKIFKKLGGEGKKACWLNINNQVDDTQIISLICNFLDHVGAKDESIQIKSSQEQLRQAELLSNAIENHNLFLFIDSYEKALPGVRKFFDVVFSKYNPSHISGGIIVTTIERYNLYNNIDLRLKKIAELNITEFSYPDFLLYFSEISRIKNEDEIKQIYNAIGGFPISMTFMKQLLNEGQIKGDEVEELLTLTIDERNKWIFEKIYLTIETEYQHFVSDLSVINYPFSIDETVQVQKNNQINIKYILQVLSDKSILIFDGKKYYMHDAVRELAYDTLVIERKMSLHEMFMNYYENNMFEKNSNRGTMFKWGFHCEQLFLLDSSKVKGINKKLMKCNDQLLTDIWGVYIAGFPFEFDDESLVNTQKRIENLLNDSLILRNEHIQEEEEEKQYHIMNFSFKDVAILEYMVLSRGLSNYMGYIEVFMPNHSVDEQPHTICIWEHCIEHFPLESERGEKSCPIFGHNCPGGIEQVSFCKAHLESAS